jgi:4-oxalocrotonate tautomerase
MGIAPMRQSESKGTKMPLVDIQLIEGVFDKNQKQEMIRKVTDTMVSIEGEDLRGVTWVRIHEIPGGNWGIGGKGMSAADVQALQKK